jgi:protein SCO1/2
LWHESETVPGLGKTVITGQATVGGPFRLTDQAGKTVTDADFRGRYKLIYFGYSFCPDVCPTTQFVGLTGSDAEIKAVEKAYRVYAAKRPLPNGTYGMDHSSVMYLMGPNGKMVSFYDEAISPDDLAKDLKQKI